MPTITKKESLQRSKAMLDKLATELRDTGKSMTISSAAFSKMHTVDGKTLDALVTMKILSKSGNRLNQTFRWIANGILINDILAEKVWAKTREIPIMRKVTYISPDGSYFNIDNPSGLKDNPVSIRMQGFVDFTNEYYGYTKSLNCNNLKIKIKDPAESKQVQDILFSKGFSWSEQKCNDHLTSNYIYTDLGKYLSYSNDDTYYECDPRQRMSGEDFITQHKTKLINQPLLKQTLNEQIIVPRQVVTIGVGERPAGQSISGRGSRARITSKHLSYQEVSCY
jgi:hypothetical protein